MFAKCCFEIVTSSCGAGPWDVSGLPVLSSSRVTLGEWVERCRQLRDVSAMLWTNMAVPVAAEFRYPLSPGGRAGPRLSSGVCPGDLGPSWLG